MQSLPSIGGGYGQHRRVKAVEQSRSGKKNKEENQVAVNLSDFKVALGCRRQGCTHKAQFRQEETEKKFSSLRFSVSPIPRFLFILGRLLSRHSSASPSTLNRASRPLSGVGSFTRP